MSENNESDARKDHVSPPNPAAERKGSEFVDGKDAGAVDADAFEREAGEYAEGDYGDAGTVDHRSSSTGAGGYTGSDYGDAGAANAGTPGRGAGEYVGGDYGEGGTLDPRSAVTRAGEYAEGDYGDAGMAHGSNVPGSRPNEVAEDQEVAPDGGDGDADGGRSEG